MKTILCYGDSNTWGYSPKVRTRLAMDDRWCGVMRNKIGSGYVVIEEGHCGRTTVWDDPIEGEHKNGKRYLLPCLETHNPIDLVILFLGVNDLKTRFGVSADDVARSNGTLIRIIQNSGTGVDGKAPQILLITPPPVASLKGTKFEEMFKGAEAVSYEFSAAFQSVVEESGVYSIDAGKIIVASALDGIHIDKDEHKKLGNAVAEEVLKILG